MSIFLFIVAIIAAVVAQVLKQQQLEALVQASKNGNLIIVPEDFAGIVNLPAKTE